MSTDSNTEQASWQPDSRSLCDTALYYFLGTLTTPHSQPPLLETLSAQLNSLPTARYALSDSGQKKLAGMGLRELSMLLLKVEDFVTVAKPKRFTEVLDTLVDRVADLIVEELTATKVRIVMHST